MRGARQACANARGEGRLWLPTPSRRLFLYPPCNCLVLFAVNQSTNHVTSSRLYPCRCTPACSCALRHAPASAGRDVTGPACERSGKLKMYCILSCAWAGTFLLCALVCSMWFCCHEGLLVCDVLEYMCVSCSVPWCACARVLRAMAAAPCAAAPRCRATPPAVPPQADGPKRKQHRKH